MARQSTKKAKSAPAPEEHILEHSLWKEKRIEGGRLFSGPVVFSNDSKYLFTYSNNIKIFNVNTGGLVRTLYGHSDLVTSVVPSKMNPFQLYSCSLDGSIILWDYNDGSILRRFKIGKPINKMEQHPLKEHLLYLITYDYHDLKIEFCQLDLTNESGTNGSISPSSLTTITSTTDISLLSTYTFALNSNGSFAAVIERNKLIILDLSSEFRIINKFYTITHITTVIFHAKDEFIATGESSGRIILWYSWLTPRPISQLAQESSNNAPASASSPASGEYAAKKMKKKLIMQKNAKRRRLFSQRPMVNFAASIRKKLDREFKAQMSGMVWSSFHWHVNAVLSLAGFPDGTHMVSGGEESVVVVWNLPTDTKRFLPRVGAPISFITVSPNEKFMALALMNNTVKIVDILSNKTRHVIRGLIHMHDSIDVSTGLLIDPREGYLTMNGVPNSLQFYDLYNDRFISELEIAAPNAVRRDIKRGSILPISRVEHSCFTSDGSWLITVDHRVSEWETDECSLKFWQYDASAQRYCLHSRVDSPHSGPITSLACHPRLPLVVTTSTDTRFKVWALGGSGSGAAGDGAASYVWRCRSVGYYRGQPCSTAAFSPDGSVLAIGSGAVVSVWDPLANTLLFTLTHPIDDIETNDCVKKVMFLQGTPLIVTLTNDRIVVWNLVSRAQWWSYAAEPSIAACDANSAVFAVALKARYENYLVVFDGYDPKPQSFLKLASKPLALAFVPENPANPSGKSPLIAYVNEHNEIVVLEKSGDDVRDDVMGKKDSEEQQQEKKGEGEEQEEVSFFQSSFIPLVQKKKTEGGEFVARSNVTSIPGIFGDIFDGPTHALPPLEKLLPVMFERLLIKSDLGSEKKNDDNDVNMNVEDDVIDNEEESEKKKKKKSDDVSDKEEDEDEEDDESMNVEEGKEEEEEEEEEKEDGSEKNVNENADFLPDEWLKYEVGKEFFILNKKAYVDIVKK